MSSIKEAKEKMDSAMEAIRREFSSVRTGKATPALLDTVRVEAYETKMPLNQVATVSTPDPSLIVIQPFDQTLMGPIERGIQVADLGLNPSNDGTVIRVPIPPLNEERRKEYVKILHRLAEEGRISVRRARREANDDIKALTKEHEIGEDESHRQLDQVQAMTDDHIKQIEDLLGSKEDEVMAI
jgi:ribosome recycling factor